MKLGNKQKKEKQNFPVGSGPSHVTLHESVFTEAS